MKLETKRLILRTPKESDWKDIVEGLNDIKVSKFLAQVPHPYKKKDALEWINKCIKKSKKKKKEDYSWFIELKSEKKVIGGTELTNIDYFRGTCNSGSWVARKYWRQGIIKETKIAVNNFAFNKLRLRRINSGAYIVNKASNAMLKKIGYKYEGKERKGNRSRATGKIHDENSYGLLKEDWIKAKKRLKKK